MLRDMYVTGGALKLLLVYVFMVGVQSCHVGGDWHIHHGEATKHLTATSVLAHVLVHRAFKKQLSRVSA